MSDRIYSLLINTNINTKIFPSFIFQSLCLEICFFLMYIYVHSLSQLTSPRMAVRKRSILALGHLVPCCSPAVFSQLTEHLLTELAKTGLPTSLTRTYIQCLATVSRQGGHRVGEICCLCSSAARVLTTLFKVITLVAWLFCF